MSAETKEEIYDYKRLFYMTCGYISATDLWKDKHPMEVVDFFLENYIDLGIGSEEFDLGSED
jgi:hypothetical protein